jgi:predicted nucleotidyltransferase
LRITKQEKDCLIHASCQSFGNNAEIWLFGSRVDDTKQGGDIDLYIETDLETGTVAAKLEMQKLLWSVFGDQKIDILVRSRNRKASPMHEIAKSSGKKL